MKNQSLEAVSRTVPYCPELRPYLGTVNAVIVFQQIEFYFARHPDGFYKCHEPCASPFYRAGDSWLEELLMSPKEFRAAFDTLGIRYRSKQAYKAAQADGDAFQGHFFASYHDRQRGYTVYKRNAARVQQLVDTLNLKDTPAGKVIYGNFAAPVTAHQAVPVTSQTDVPVCDQKAVPQYTEKTPESGTESLVLGHQSPEKSFDKHPNLATLAGPLGGTMNAKDALAQVLAKKKAPPVKVNTTALAHAWSRSVSESTGDFVPELTMQQKGMLSQYLKRVESEPVAVLECAVRKWKKFTEMVSLEKGIATHPSKPHIPYLLKHVDTAVVLWKEQKAVAEAPVPKAPAPKLHSSAKVEKAGNAPASLEEVMKIVGASE